MNRRLLIIYLFFMLFFLFLIFYLFFMIKLKGDDYKQLAKKNKTRIIMLSSSRGKIFDRNNIILATNSENYLINVVNNKNSKENVENVLDLLNIASKERKNIDKKLSKKQGLFIPILNLNWNDLSKIENFSYRIKGIAIDKNYIRNYLHPTTFAHVIGYVGATENDIKNKAELDKVGITGIEKTFDDYITGLPGYREVEVNSAETIVNNISTVKSNPGQNVNLTLDYNLQKYVEERMSDINGAVIVMDVKTGEILSMFSSPSFNTNHFIDGIEKDYWDELIKNPSKPLNNRAVSITYPPGSTFKLMTALAALEKGWNNKKEVLCTGELQLNKLRTLHCWNRHGHGKIDLLEAIKHSCNIYFAELGTFTGIDNIYKVARNFGFGEKFDLELTNIRNGILPNREWKKSVLKDIWVVGDTVNVAIGQGFLTSTPLELVVMTARIANGGYPIKPFITISNPIKKYNEGLFKKNSMVKQENMEIVHRGMYKVVNEPGGTSYFYRIEREGFEMSGKTGTAQVISKDMATLLRERKRDLTKFRNHGIFIAFAPSHDPKYAIVVVSEHGMSGAGSAAPIARDVLLFAQENKI